MFHANGDDSPTHAPVFDAQLTQLVPAPAPAPFELYVLAQSWQPAFCLHRETEFPGCRAPREFWRTHFTLHGLWPEHEAGSPPGFCDGEPFDADAVEQAVGLDVLREFWPDVKYSDASPQYPQFWAHEWTRHGTCSGLPLRAYFSSAVGLARNGTAQTPQIVQESVGKQVALTELRAAFAARAPSAAHGAPLSEELFAAVLQCTGHGGDTLSQVFTCWSKDAQNVPVARRACPPHVLKEDSCTRPMIRVLAFPDSGR
ncbi:hypothetical protein PybrP1_000389 [[Pythium] brassicae (nom. inval.)]|nr:hypothetical protein PybrP1_000389 [[Pythium] brassicae (nom. inval.)]